MAYGARQWATKSFGDGLGAPDLAVPPAATLVLYGPGAYGSSSIGVNAYGGPAMNMPGVIPPVVYAVSLVGALPITGALGPKSQLAMAASMALSGTLARTANKGFVATLTSAGTLTMRASDIRINGQVTPTGILHKLVVRSWTSSLTPAGALHSRAVFGPGVLAGSLEMFGTLDIHKQNPLPTVTATITPVAVLVRKALKVFEASLFPHGSVTLGIQSPGGYAGTIAPQGSLTLTYPGGLTALAQIIPAGRLHLTVVRSFAGTVTSSSSTQKVSGHGFTATITPHGAVTGSGRRSVTVSGSVTPTGAYRPSPQKRISGSVGAVGALVRAVDLYLAGTVSSSGSRTLEGPGVGPDSFLMVESALTPRGRVSFEVLKNLTGTITPASNTVAIYYEPMVLVPGFVYTKYRRGVLLP